MNSRIILVVLALVVAAAGGYWLGNEHRNEDTGYGIQGQTERKVLYYRNPMGLPDTSPVPRKDAMGMDYVAVYEGDEQASAVVSISPDKVQKLGVKSEAATMRVLDKTLRASGRIEIDEKRTYTIAPKFEGWVEKLFVNTTGQAVSKGQPLFEVYSPELVSALREQTLATQGVASLKDADEDAQNSMKKLAEASATRLKNWDIAEGQLEKDRVTFRSPVSGVVLEKKAVQGMRFMPGEMLYQIADLSRVWVIADVPEQDIGAVKAGDKAQVSVDAYPDKPFDGTVSFIYPTLNSATRTVQVRVEVSNPKGLLKPSMFAYVQIGNRKSGKVLTVPASAVIDSGTRQVVLVRLAEGRFEPRTVTPGNRSDTYIEVLSGIAEGEQVVTSANFLLDSESNLKTALSGMSEQAAQSATPATAQEDHSAHAAPTQQANKAKVIGHQGAGTLEAINDDGTVSITHGPIQSLGWPGMTMDFALANSSLAAGIKPGSAITFELVERNPGEWVITKMQAQHQHEDTDMLSKIIEWSARNRFLVLLATLFITLAGIYALVRTPLDALPDLSDVQVIVYTEYPGQAPQVVEDQVTYPLSTAMLAVPKSRVVRGFSFFGASFVYVIFEDGTDIYWARSRVLEYLNSIAGRLPQNVAPQLGPDASGVGWVYQYAVLSDKHNLAELRTMQDWYLRYQLTQAHGVAEVASIGGFVQQYQVTVDPVKLRSYGIPLGKVAQVIRDSNRDVGGRVVEMAETEYMVRGRGYLRGKGDIENLVVKSERGTPVLLRDIARVELGPDERRGIAELNGEGEVVSGIAMARYGQNALEVIRNIKDKIAEITPGLEGVSIQAVYDRSELILRAIATLKKTLFEEGLIVALVCMVFLMHARSALVAIVMLPIGVLIAFIAMRALGLNSNIMSLGGIAIAIGAMVDAAIVMIENAHKHLERLEHYPTDSPSPSALAGEGSGVRPVPILAFP